jgi:hypothetical protein
MAKVTRAKIVDKVKLVVTWLAVFCLLLAWIFYSRSHLALTRDESRFIDYCISYAAVGLYMLLKHTPFRRWQRRQQATAIGLGALPLALGFLLFYSGVLQWPADGWAYYFAGLASFLTTVFLLIAVSKDWDWTREN